jgi:hypothetical protein
LKLFCKIHAQSEMSVLLFFHQVLQHKLCCFFMPRVCTKLFLTVSLLISSLSISYDPASQLASDCTSYLILLAFSSVHFATKKPCLSLSLISFLPSLKCLFHLKTLLLLIELLVPLHAPFKCLDKVEDR